MDLGSISTIGVTVGQTLTFNLAAKVWGPSQEELGQGLSDILCINNLSGVTFQVTLQPSTRQFTLPPGVPTNPLQLAWKGITTTFLTLYVESIASGTFANQVHFDWFAPGEPVLYVAASSVGATGSISVPNVTTNSVTWPTPDNWIMQEDGGGNMDLTDSTTGLTYAFGRAGNLSAPSNFGTFFVANIPNTSTDQNACLDMPDATSGAVHWSLGKQSHVNGDGFRLIDVTHGVAALVVSAGSGGVQILGPIASLGSQASVGNFGVAVIVAQTLNQTIGSTGSTNILVYGATGNNHYRIYVDVWLGNSTAEKITVSVAWTDPTTSTTRTEFFYSPAYGGICNGAQTSGLALIPLALAPLTLSAKSGTNITVAYNDPAGTPNDRVTAIIERLA